MGNVLFPLSCAQGCLPRAVETAKPQLKLRINNPSQGLQAQISFTVSKAVDFFFPKNPQLKKYIYKKTVYL